MFLEYFILQESENNKSQEEEDSELCNSFAVHKEMFRPVFVRVFFFDFKSKLTCVWCIWKRCVNIFR